MNWEKIKEINSIDFDDQVFIVYGENSICDSMALSEILIQDELAYSERLKGLGQKSTWLSCRTTLRLLLSHFLKKHPLQIVFEKGNFGKPYIANTNLSFNVSHSKNAFLIGLSNYGRIGIDTEVLTGLEDLPSLVNFAFSQEEAKYCQYGESPDLFTRIWTLKEAFLKATGVGLVDNLSDISVVGNLNNYILHFAMVQKSFLSPNNEIGSVVYRKEMPIRFIWFSPAST